MGAASDFWAMKARSKTLIARTTRSLQPVVMPIDLVLVSDLALRNGPRKMLRFQWWKRRLVGDEDKGGATQLVALS